MWATGGSLRKSGERVRLDRGRSVSGAEENEFASGGDVWVAERRRDRWLYARLEAAGQSGWAWVKVERGGVVLSADMREVSEVTPTFQRWVRKPRDTGQTREAGDTT